MALRTTETLWAYGLEKLPLPAFDSSSYLKSCELHLSILLLGGQEATRGAAARGARGARGAAAQGVEVDALPQQADGVPRAQGSQGAEPWREQREAAEALATGAAVPSHRHQRPLVSHGGFFGFTKRCTTSFRS